jgi:hypothetical protein
MQTSLFSCQIGAGPVADIFFTPPPSLVAPPSLFAPSFVPPDAKLISSPRDSMRGQWIATNYWNKVEVSPSFFGAAPILNFVGAALTGAAPHSSSASAKIHYVSTKFVKTRNVGENYRVRSPQ